MFGFLVLDLRHWLYDWTEICKQFIYCLPFQFWNNKLESHQTRCNRFQSSLDVSLVTYDYYYFLTVDVVADRNIYIGSQSAMKCSSMENFTSAPLAAAWAEPPPPLTSSLGPGPGLGHCGLHTAEASLDTPSPVWGVGVVCNLWSVVCGGVVWYESVGPLPVCQWAGSSCGRSSGRQLHHPHRHHYLTPALTSCGLFTLHHTIIARHIIWRSQTKLSCTNNIYSSLVAWPMVLVRSHITFSSVYYCTPVLYYLVLHW